MITLPLRQTLPAFYIAGFPKCGTTSLASQLRRHPAVSGLAGLPYHEVLNKESHFLNGVLGPCHAASRLLYQSFFPTVFTKFWAENIIGVKRWMAFDACPLTACLPFAANRLSKLTPKAKIVFMLREPARAIFSGEIMLRNMGMPLQWTLSEESQALGSMFEEQQDETQLWQDMAALGPTDPLPAHMPHLLYTRLGSLMRFCDYPERLAPFLEHFPAENLMFIDFKEFVEEPEAVIRNVLDFLGLEQHLFRYEQLPPGMKKYIGWEYVAVESAAEAMIFTGHRYQPYINARLHLPEELLWLRI
ncbi:hypothetical protein WJX84_007576 [Apatococcus fuscideae]|uniref:Sulfotransferase n=1 Tax=Apatococcus fuscideae TaxID=2026836 RepID=A0AAW1SIU2_9CHLO